MGVSFRVYGTVDAFPSIDELIEVLEDSEFEVTIETEDEDEDEWSDLLVFEPSIEGPVNAFRLDGNEFDDEVEDLLDALKGCEPGQENSDLVRTLQNAVICFGVDLPDDLVDDDNALLVASLLAQQFAARCDGVYCVDGEGFFDDSGELILELATGE